MPVTCHKWKSQIFLYYFTVLVDILNCLLWPFLLQNDDSYGTNN